jgi:hypothetical protein
MPIKEGLHFWEWCRFKRCEDDDYVYVFKT